VSEIRSRRSQVMRVWRDESCAQTQEPQRKPTEGSRADAGECVNSAPMRFRRAGRCTMGDCAVTPSNGLTWTQPIRLLRFNAVKGARRRPPVEGAIAL
jgi:hypothetical protein